MKLVVFTLSIAIVATNVNSILADDKKQGDVPEYVNVEVQGTMSQVMAIGGETTGIQIRANGISWELDLADDRDLRKVASKLFDSKVHVTGTLQVKRGVEIRQRWIVKVKTLGPARKNPPYISDGKLAKTISFKDAQGGFAGFTGRIWTIKPDGSWQRQSFLNADLRDADQEGKLTEEQLKQLAATLSKADLLGLPDRLGKNQGANPHVFTITFGEKRSSFTLRTSAPLPAGGLKSQESRFATIASEILKLAKPARE